MERTVLMVTSSLNGRPRGTTLLLVALMLFQAAPLLTVSASTTPPSTGDWNIQYDEVAYLNSTDQALVQGNLHIYGELHINGGNLFMWGASDNQRQLRVHSGGLLNVTNGGLIASFTSVFYTFVVDDFAHLRVTDSRIEKASQIQSSSLNMTMTNVHLEDTQMYLQDDWPYYWNGGETGVWDASQNAFGANWVFDNLRFVNGTYGTAIYFAASLSFNDWTLTLTDIDISIPSTASYANTIEVYSPWETNLVFDGLSISDATRKSSTPSINAQNWLLNHAHGPHLEIRNSLFYDSPEHKAIYSNSDMVLSNVTITDIYHPDQTNDWYYYGESNGSQDHDTYTRLIEIHPSYNMIADRLTIENSGVMTQQKTGESMVLCGNANGSVESCWMGGPDFMCTAIFAGHAWDTTLTLSNSSITGNCLAQFEYNGQQISSYDDSNCLSYPDNLDDSYFGSSHYDAACREYRSYAVEAGTAHISDSSIESNAKMTVWFSYPSTDSYSFRHGTIHTGGVKVIHSSTIDNSSVSNNGDSCMCAHTSHPSQHLTLSSYQVLARTSSADAVYINNSFLNTTMTPDEDQNDPSWGAFQHWYSFGISQGTAFITDTELNHYNGSMNWGVVGDANPGQGEVVRQWTVQVRVTDPDGVFTPNASVTAYENNGMWNLGTWSTGPNGSAVDFIGRQYSLTESSNYSYTPHLIEVVMPGYPTASTSMSITGPMIFTVIDPSPDDFPGDITQDLDSDGDGYGDNISGNNPDYYPQDPTQWSDVDGDGWGDNYTWTVSSTNGLRIQNGDAFINDATQWSDVDGDGWGDNYTWIIGWGGLEGPER